MRLNKCIFLLTAFILCGWAGAQCSCGKNPIYLKANVSTLPVGILNAGAELQLTDRYSAQGDFLISPWKSFAGNHAQVYMMHLEGRYYFHKTFEKWYIGLHAGTGLFNITKWHYKALHRYQKGFAIMAGATVGYQFKLSRFFNLDTFIGGGTAQSLYRGYEITDAGHVRYDGAEDWNKSGEILPYRGGVMLSYKF